MNFDHFQYPESSCGVSSSGGTEIVFLDMLYLIVEVRKRRISKPNVFAPFTAHAAFDMASFYLGLELIKVKKDQDPFYSSI